MTKTRKPGFKNRVCRQLKDSGENESWLCILHISSHYSTGAIFIPHLYAGFPLGIVHISLYEEEASAQCVQCKSKYEDDPNQYVILYRVIH